MNDVLVSGPVNIHSLRSCLLLHQLWGCPPCLPTVPKRYCPAHQDLPQHLRTASRGWGSDDCWIWKPWRSKTGKNFKLLSINLWYFLLTLWIIYAIDQYCVQPSVHSIYVSFYSMLTPVEVYCITTLYAFTFNALMLCWVFCVLRLLNVIF